MPTALSSLRTREARSQAALRSSNLALSSAAEVRGGGMTRAPGGPGGGRPGGSIASANAPHPSLPHSPGPDPGSGLCSIPGLSVGSGTPSPTDPESSSSGESPPSAATPRKLRRSDAAGVDRKAAPPAPPLPPPPPPPSRAKITPSPSLLSSFPSSIPPLARPPPAAPPRAEPSRGCPPRHAPRPRPGVIQRLGKRGAGGREAFDARDAPRSPWRPGPGCQPVGRPASSAVAAFNLSSAGS